jgi:hypothetical protein
MMAGAHVSSKCQVITLTESIEENWSEIIGTDSHRDFQARGSLIPVSENVGAAREYIKPI